MPADGGGPASDRICRRARDARSTCRDRADGPAEGAMSAGGAAAAAAAGGAIAWQAGLFGGSRRSDEASRSCRSRTSAAIRPGVSLGRPDRGNPRDACAECRADGPCRNDVSPARAETMAKREDNLQQAGRRLPPRRLGPASGRPRPGVDQPYQWQNRLFGMVAKRRAEARRHIRFPERHRAERLRRLVRADGDRRSALGGTRNAKAYEAYLRGKALYNLAKDERNRPRGARQFRSRRRKPIPNLLWPMRRCRASSPQSRRRARKRAN